MIGFIYHKSSIIMLILTKMLLRKNNLYLNSAKLVKLLSLMLIVLCLHQVEAISTTCGSKKNISEAIASGCSLCPENCRDCSDSKSCNKCNLLTQYFNGQKCQVCKENCSECSSSGECSKCLNNYFLKSGFCYPCSNGCSRCTSPTVCTSCKTSDGFFSSLGTCKECSKGCNECSDSTTCTRCRSGFFLKKDTNQCNSCPKNCQRCSDKTQCSICMKGFYKQSDGTCKSCSSLNPLCTTCKGINQFTSCKEGFYPDSSSNKCKTCLSKYGDGCYGGCNEKTCYCRGEGTTLFLGQCSYSLEVVFLNLFGIFLILLSLVMCCVWFSCGFFCPGIFDYTNILGAKSRSDTDTNNLNETELLE